jgi:hypothetical protein
LVIEGGREEGGYATGMKTVLQEHLPLCNISFLYYITLWKKECKRMENPL